MNSIAYTDEQKCIIDASLTHNCAVNAVAGSGKTTTIIGICHAYKESNKNILILTYNASLKEETRARLRKQNLDMCEAHNYNSFALHYYGAEYNSILYALDRTNTRKKLFQFHLVIIDEAQDMTPSFYQLTKRIIEDNGYNPMFVLLGDKHQSIYQFMKADFRFLTLAQQMFPSEKEYSELTLRETFRCTRNMCTFINSCVNRNNWMSSNKEGPKVLYVDCNTFETRTIWYKIFALKKEHQLRCDDFFFLFPSLKAGNKAGEEDIQPLPVRLVNFMKKEYGNSTLIYVANGEETVDPELVKNKVVFSSYHKVKGLERKCVIVFGFDDSYFKYFNRGADGTYLTNEQYVAISRASKLLVVVQNKTSGMCQFLQNKLHDIGECMELVSWGRQVKEKEEEEEQKSHSMSISNFLSHVRDEVITQALKNITILQVTPPQRKVKYASKLKCKVSYELDNSIGEKNYAEAVDMIIGQAVPLYVANHVYHVGVLTPPDTLFPNLDTSIWPDKTEENWLWYTLFEANKLCSMEYVHSLYQILRYNFISENAFMMLVRRLEKTCKKIGEKKEVPEVEVEITRDAKDDLPGLHGRLDMVFEGSVIEVKCVGELTSLHKLQLCMYMLLVKSKNNSVKEGASAEGLTRASARVGKPSFPHFVLYNCRTDECLEIRAELHELVEMAQFVWRSKQTQEVMTDDEFVRAFDDLT